jgi:hypothetical protein
MADWRNIQSRRGFRTDPMSFAGALRCATVQPVAFMRPSPFGDHRSYCLLKIGPAVDRPEPAKPHRLVCGIVLMNYRLPYPCSPSEDHYFFSVSLPTSLTPPMALDAGVSLIPGCRRRDERVAHADLRQAGTRGFSLRGALASGRGRCNGVRRRRWLRRRWQSSATSGQTR